MTLSILINTVAKVLVKAAEGQTFINVLKSMKVNFDPDKADVAVQSVVTTKKGDMLIRAKGMKDQWPPVSASPKTYEMEYRSVLTCFAFQVQRLAEYEKYMGTNAFPSLSPRVFGVNQARLDESGLSKPVLVMLQQLLAKGPSAQGIFRKSANLRVVRELRDQTESSGYISCLEDASVLAVAALLKDFLRSLPNSLLTSHLFSLWIDSLESPDPLKTIKSTLDCLSRANYMLLLHLIGVLHHTARRSKDNVMCVFVESVQFMCGSCGLRIERNCLDDHPWFLFDCFLTIADNYIYFIPNNNESLQLVLQRKATVIKNDLETSKVFENALPVNRISKIGDNNVSIRQQNQLRTETLACMEGKTKTKEPEVLWTADKVKLLLHLYVEINNRYADGTVLTKKHLYRSICDKMTKHGCDFDVHQLENKLRNLKDQELENAFRNDHAVIPTATIDNTKIYRYVVCLRRLC
ncbi:T-cell activation Rho GTPase-activating protein-like [Copidosoma floridanum]|uniref:T-cell activation Rho GTPase-activating protein-like n=1 Tax=Copidosoma floridanum TaxID=29053 RepID=UPI0006C9E56B|nr:T-cell activation Rho GTPase-activating protein-like [Copidosoma floridanum]